MYNKVIMLGRITQDLELKTTPNGVSVLQFSIACDRRYQTKGEEKKSDFFNCVAWRNEAEFISKYWSKGRPILIEGELQNRSYDDKNGVKRYVTEIIVDRATFTGDKKPEVSGSGNSAPPPPPPQQSSDTGGGWTPASPDANVKVDASSGSDDDYPF